MLALALMTLALGCGEADAPDDTGPADDTGVSVTPPGFDYASLCAGVWPANDCADGCADSEEEEVWEEAFLRFAAEQVGVPESELGNHVILRQLDVQGASNAQAVLTFVMQLDWARVPVVQDFYIPADDLTVDDVIEEFESFTWFPKPHWDAELRPVEDLLAEEKACEETYEVEIDDIMWCEAWVTESEDSKQWIRYDGSSDYFVDGNDHIFFSLDPAGIGESKCEPRQSYGY